MIGLKKKGYTLIELSVVILILSTLMVALTSLKSIKNNAIAQGVMQEIFQYRTAIMTFYKTYNYLPGILPNANNILNKTPYSSLTSTSITDSNYDSLAINPRDCVYSTGCYNTKPGTISYVQYIFGSSSKYRFSAVSQVWLQLYLANILNISYKGAILNDNSSFIKAGINFPKSDTLNNESGYNIFYPDTVNLVAIVKTSKTFTSDRHHVMILSKTIYDNSFDITMYENDKILAIPSIVLSIIDKYMDDGFADKGNIGGYGASLKNDCFDVNGRYSSKTYDTCVGYIVLQEL